MTIRETLYRPHIYYLLEHFHSKYCVLIVNSIARKPHIKCFQSSGTGETSQWIKPLPTHADERGSVSGTHTGQLTITCNSSFGSSAAL